MGTYVSLLQFSSFVLTVVELGLRTCVLEKKQCKRNVDWITPAMCKRDRKSVV